MWKQQFKTGLTCFETWSFVYICLYTPRLHDKSGCRWLAAWHSLWRWARPARIPREFVGCRALLQASRDFSAKQVSTNTDLFCNIWAVQKWNTGYHLETLAAAMATNTLPHTMEILKAFLDVPAFPKCDSFTFCYRPSHICLKSPGSTTWKTWFGQLGWSCPTNVSQLHLGSPHKDYTIDGQWGLCNVRRHLKSGQRPTKSTNMNNCLLHCHMFCLCLFYRSLLSGIKQGLMLVANIQKNARSKWRCRKELLLVGSMFCCMMGYFHSPVRFGTWATTQWSFVSLQEQLERRACPCTK